MENQHRSGPLFSRRSGPLQAPDQGFLRFSELSTDRMIMVLERVLEVLDHPKF